MVLLRLTIDTMLQVIKLTSVKHVLQVVTDKEAFFQLLVSILQLNNKDLLSIFRNLFDHIRSPPSLQRKIKEEQVKQGKAITSEKKQQI